MDQYTSDKQTPQYNLYEERLEIKHWPLKSSHIGRFKVSAGSDTLVSLKWQSDTLTKKQKFIYMIIYI